MNIRKIISILQEFRAYVSLCIAAGKRVLKLERKHITVQTIQMVVFKYFWLLWSVFSKVLGSFMLT